MSNHKTNKNVKRLSPKVKDIWMYCIATFTVLIGWIITMIGLFLEPQGQIHSSVLITLGQSLVWSAAIFGIPYYVKNEFGEFKTAIVKYINKKADSITLEGEEEHEEGREN